MINLYKSGLPPGGMLLFEAVRKNDAGGSGMLIGPVKDGPKRAPGSVEKGSVVMYETRAC